MFGNGFNIGKGKEDSRLILRKLLYCLHQLWHHLQAMKCRRKNGIVRERNGVVGTLLREANNQCLICDRRLSTNACKAFQKLRRKIWIQDADLEVIKIKMIEEMVIDIIVN